MSGTVQATVLYRPVGQRELDLIRQSEYREFPPRLAGQPFFYPVLSEEYAEKIARDWNAKHEADQYGYVTRFQVRTSFRNQYEIKIVGSSEHREYWIPAEDLPTFNQNIVGKIEVVAQFKAAD